jgi:hypothetical protein
LSNKKKNMKPKVEMPEETTSWWKVKPRSLAYRIMKRAAAPSPGVLNGVDSDGMEMDRWNGFLLSSIGIAVIPIGFDVQIPPVLVFWGTVIHISLELHRYRHLCVFSVVGFANEIISILVFDMEYILFLLLKKWCLMLTSILEICWLYSIQMWQTNTIKLDYTYSNIIHLSINYNRLWPELYRQALFLACQSQ